MFAKLFTTALGQVVVIAAQNHESAPVIEFTFETQDLGVVRSSLEYPNTSVGLNRMRGVFDGLDDRQVVKMVSYLEVKIRSNEAVEVDVDLQH